MSARFSVDSQQLLAARDAPTNPFARHYIRHRLATSRMAGPLSTIRSVWSCRRLWRHPELSLLLDEDRMTAHIFRRVIQPDWNCLDVGAHLGSVTYQFVSLAPHGKHASIEALPGKAALLAKRFPDLPVFQVAASDEDGQVGFFENTDAPGFSGLSERKTRGRTRKLRVPSRRIDTLFSSDHSFDLIKIDVEGHEYNALCGASELIRRCRPMILFEAGPTGDPEIPDERYDSLFRLLTEKFGYEVRAVFDSYFGRNPISAQTFRMYRTYPFLAFNYIATYPEETSMLPKTKES